MNVKLIRPDNGQRSDFREYRDGMIALDTTCVTPAMRWFTMQAVQVCNPTANVLAAFDSGLLYTVPENIYPQALWLGIANGVLEMSKRKLDIRVVIADTEILGMVA